MGGCDGAVSKAAESRRPLAEATHTSAKAQDAVDSAVNGSPAPAGQKRTAAGWGPFCQNGGGTAAGR